MRMDAPSAHRTSSPERARSPRASVRSRRGPASRTQGDPTDWPGGQGRVHEHERANGDRIDQDRRRHDRRLPPGGYPGRATARAAQPPIVIRARTPLSLARDARPARIPIPRTAPIHPNRPIRPEIARRQNQSAAAVAASTIASQGMSAMARWREQVIQRVDEQQQRRGRPGPPVGPRVPGPKTARQPSVPRITEGQRAARSISGVSKRPEWSSYHAIASLGPGRGYPRCEHQADEILRQGRQVDRRERDPSRVIEFAFDQQVEEEDCDINADSSIQ